MGVEVVGRGGAPGGGGVRLHCFPHAGGSAAAFRRWVGAFGEVPVVAACGGDDGSSGSVGVLVDRWRARTADRSGVYYGHSLGALVAFEAAVAAFEEGDVRQVPSAVVLGAPPAPGRRVPVSALGPVVGAGGVRRRSWERDLVRELERVRRYRPSQVRLPVPVHVLRGALDDVVGEEEARAWVGRGGPGSAWYPVPRAGHLFHLVPGEDVRAVVQGVLDAAAQAAVAA